MANPRIDPITYEVVKNKLRQIVTDQTIALRQISGSPIVTEAIDFNNGLLLPGDGGSLVIGVGSAQHADSLSRMVKCTTEDCQENPGINEDDMFFCSDPWKGPIHQSDPGIVAPIFYKGELILWAGTLAHQIDVGGAEFGSWVPWATEVFQEGVPIPPIKIVERGVVRQDVWRMIMAHTRLPFLVSLDLKGFIGANNMAKRRLIELLDRYGVDTVKAVMDEVISETEHKLRALLMELPDGSYRSTILWDHSGQENVLNKTTVNITKERDTLTIDYTGTDPCKGFINNTASATMGGLGSAVLCNLGFSFPWNGGIFGPIKAIIPSGTLVGAEYPTAVGGSPCTEQMITVAVTSQSLAKMLACSDKYKEKAMVAMNYAFTTLNLGGLDQYGEPYGTMLLDSLAGGEGALSWRDGASGQCVVGNTTPNIADVESNENFSPLLYLSRKLYRDQGGAGKWKGGEATGIVIALHDTESLKGVLVGHGHETPQPGLFGGMPSGCSANIIVKGSDIYERWKRGEMPTELDELKGEKQVLGAKPGPFAFNKGDVLENRYNAAGGYGDPLDRPPELVLKDVVDGKVSIDWAEKGYGVIIEPKTLQVNVKGTEKERKRILQDRLKLAKKVRRVTQVNAQEGVRLMPMGDFLEVIKIDEQKLVRCRCGYQFGPITQNWKENAAMALLPEEKLNPLAKLHKDLEARQYICPNCGLQLEVELVRKGDPSLFDIELKI